MDFKEAILTLTNLYGGSGNEFAVSEAVADMIKPVADSVTIDGYGNVTALRRAKKAGAKKLLFDAHIDQMCMMVTGLTDDGFIRFSASGFDPRQIYGAEVLLITKSGERFDGVVTTLPKELETGDRQKTVDIKVLSVDIGMPKAFVEGHISVGDYIYFANETMILDGSMLCGRAMDDRAAAAAMIDAMYRMKDETLENDTYFCFTSREEVGGPGAAICSFNIRPDLAVAVDGNHGKCYANAGPMTHPMDCGALIGYGDHSNKHHAEKFIRIADKYGIKYEKNLIPANSKTNAGRYQFVADGIATVVIEFPMIYAHSAVEEVTIPSMKEVAELIYRFATDPESMQEVK